MKPENNKFQYGLDEKSEEEIDLYSRWSVVGSYSRWMVLEGLYIATGVGVGFPDPTVLTFVALGRRWLSSNLET